jgi:hypothetical protein
MEAPVENRTVDFKRVLLSFFLAPPLGSYIFVFLWILFSNGFEIRIFMLSMVGTLIGMIIAYPVMLFFGLITTILFDYNRIQSIIWYALLELCLDFFLALFFSSDNPKINL